MNLNIDFDFKKLHKFILPAIIVLFLIICGFNCTYQVKEQEQAVLSTFGSSIVISDSGLHFKLPFIQRVQKVDTTIRGFAIGYDVQSGNSIEEESLMITNDYNFVNVDFFIEYQVTDPVKLLYSSDDPVSILKNIAQSCIRTEIGSSKVDDVLTTGKGQIQGDIKEMITNQLEKFDFGITLVNITIQDAEPPTQEVMIAFKAVETAKQGKDTALNNAEKYKNEKIPDATAQADKILQEAAGLKESRINEATGQVARFEKMYKEYAKFPEVTKQRLFYEAIEDLLPSLKVVINSSNGTQNVLFIGSEQFSNIGSTTNNTDSSNSNASTNSSNSNANNSTNNNTNGNATNKEVK